MTVFYVISSAILLKHAVCMVRLKTFGLTLLVNIYLVDGQVLVLVLIIMKRFFMTLGDLIVIVLPVRTTILIIGGHQLKI